MVSLPALLTVSSMYVLSSPVIVAQRRERLNFLTASLPLQYVNEAWHQISGIEGLETVNNWALVVHPEHRAAFMALWNRAIIEQMSISQFEFRWSA